jgi:hypothetical protein
MSVTIVGIEKKTNAKTKEAYLVLVVQGSAEAFISKATGRTYISASRSSVPCALDEAHAKSLIGQTLPGKIEKVECNEFEIKTPTGKKIKISHTFQYSPESVTTE